MDSSHFKQVNEEFEALRSAESDSLAGRLSDHIAYVIRKAILSGNFKLGMPMRERDLAKELGVSRTPVREALFMLQAEGLIELSHNKSARVAHFSHEDLLRVYALRSTIEGLSAEYAAMNREPQAMMRIDQALDEFKNLGENATPLEQAQADLEFHEAILEAANLPLLSTAAKRVLAVTATIRSRSAYTAEQLALAATQHESIVAAIKSGDFALAKWLMTAHVGHSKALATEHLQLRTETP